jgi:GDPmannose 4,6-dehydratase
MYGDNSAAPQNELTPFSPVSPYACSKVAAHNLVVNYRKAYDLFACSGILFNHESERRGEQFVTRKITKAAARITLGIQKELRLGNLDAKRDWGYAKEYVEVMWKMLQHETPDDYVVGTGKTYTIREFISCVSEIVGYDIMQYVVIDDTFKRPSEVPLLQANPSKARNILGWSPKISLKELAEIMYKSDLEKEKQNVR